MIHRTLITGGGGQIGSEVARQLAARGRDVSAAIHSPDKLASIELPEGVEAVHFDWDDPKTWDRAVVGVDRIMIIAPSVDPDPYHHMMPAIERFRDEGITRFVTLSLMGIENEPDASLRKVEEHFERSGSDWTHLRPNWFMQNFSTLYADMIDHTNAIYLPAGEGKVSFVDVRDVAAVAATVLDEDGHNDKAYTLTGPEALTHHEVAEIISQESGREIEYVAVTDEDAREGMIEQGMRPESIEMLLALYNNVRQGWAAPVSDDVHQVTGRPAITFDQYAAEYGRIWRRGQEAG